MARWLALAVGAGAVAVPLIGAGLVLARRSGPGDASPELRPGDDEEEELEPAPPEPEPSPSLQLVRNLDRLGGEVEPRLQAFLEWWDRAGPFLVTVGLHGGIRRDAALQEQLWRDQKTNARYLWETPHGRGGAVDLWVYKPGTLIPDFDSSNPKTLARYEEIGRLGKANGFVWGGDWRRRDLVHLEVPDWRALPFPPRFNG